MPFGSSAPRITERVDYAGVIFNHLRLISEGGQHLFDIKSDESGGQSTVSSRLRSYYAQILTLEGFLWPCLSAQYFRFTVPAKEDLAKHYITDGDKYYEGIMFLLRKLMIEINNHGWLFKEIQTADDEIEALRNAKDS